MALMLEVVAETLPVREHVHPDYILDSRFNPSWWQNSSAKSPVTYCRLLDEQAEEVARAKILPGSRTGLAYPTYTVPPDGVVEIDLLEVRVDMRHPRRGLGAQAVNAIQETYGAPIIALSLNEESDLFWSGLGWTVHLHEDGDRPSRLFSSC
jgi:hypothetical protein